MAELKTKKTELSVDKFIGSIKEKEKREDALAIIDLMKKAAKAEPKMWGSAIIGFGDTVLKYDSGRELDWFKIGFSPRKANFALYVGVGDDKHKSNLAKLGKFEMGKGCLYIKKLKDVDAKVLKSIIETTVKSK